MPMCKIRELVNKSGRPYLICANGATVCFLVRHSLWPLVTEGLDAPMKTGKE
jgi:hypothetical protein